MTWQVKALATASIVCLVDAANCVRLAHDDWTYPAALALFAAMAIQKGVNQ